jgi:hypothetical protein
MRIVLKQEKKNMFLKIQSLLFLIRTMIIKLGLNIILILMTMNKLHVRVMLDSMLLELQT